MGVKKLKNHIPIASPARREPAEGKESAMRVSLGFEPAWFHKRCGVDFSEKWHKDPYYRHETLVDMKRELCTAFPTVEYWDEDYKDDLWTISGCYGSYVIPKVFGFSLQYGKDRWPDLSKENEKLTDNDIKNLNVDDLLCSPFVGELFDQMEVIRSEWGKIHGYLNWQGVLNNAFALRGQEIFTDFYRKPDLVHHLLSVISEVMIKLAKMVQQKQRESGFHIDQFSVSNCTVNMISPQTYGKFLFPYDKKIAESNFERFGVHTCNWDVTPYLEELRKLPKVGYLDMGIMSDMEKAKQMFPEVRRAVMYSPVRLEDATYTELREDMMKIYNELSPCDVVMADIKNTTPDGRVNELLEICQEIEKGGN